MRDRPGDATSVSADAVVDRSTAIADHAGADEHAAAADHWASGCERVIEQWVHQTSQRRFR